MTTYGAMQDRIADEVTRSDLTSQIQKSIQTAIKRYEREEFYFNVTTGTFSTVAGQEYYGTAANSDIPNIARLISATIDIDGSESLLEIIGYEEIERLSDGSSRADPDNIAYYTQRVRLYPIPNAIRIVTLTYIDRFAELSASGDTNAWMTDGEELIRTCAKADLFNHVIRSYDEADRMSALCERAYMYLRRETARRRGPVKLRTEIGASAPYNIYSDA